MNATSPFSHLQRFRVLIAATIVHALIVLLLWLGMFYAHLELISGRWWVLLVWLWFVWPLLLVLNPARTLKSVAVPVYIAVALMVPCIPAAFALTAWSLVGFAP